MSQKLSQVKPLFLQAVEIKEPNARAAFLDQACRGEPEIRAQVDRLLWAHQEMGDFKPGAEASTLPHITEQPGTVVGHYKLLQQIGEGGFGVVFMAEQTHPIRRNVALKIIKPGMDTRQIVARFEAERQALALMDHPNIAHVLDAGSTETGRPYFVMELVKGICITDYCDRYNLTLHERLELFATVCNAVQHAHHKGVIHRDIKPSNVLITLHDGRPVPKVIDFGIAKAVNQRLTQQTLFTNFAQMIGTPLYMSPEQAELSGLDVDTRTDIYSLGVLLYELLTGTTPFERQRLHEAAVDEIRRIIREEDPPRPSTRLSTLGETLPGIAAHRRTEPRKLSVLMRGELDWIVMKALEKDRTRRYDTANAFAVDVLRYLNNEPVQACPPSRVYRFRTFARRNSGVLTAAAIVALALLIGSVVSTWQAIRATSAERLAEFRFDAEQAARQQAQTQERLARIKQAEAATEAAKATITAELLLGMLASADPTTAKGADYTVRQLLDDFSLRLGDELADQPEVEASIRTTIGSAYSRLGMPLSAEPHLQRALDLRRSHLGPHHPMVAHNLLELSRNLSEQQRYDDAERNAREALSLYRKLAPMPREQINALYHLALPVARRQDLSQMEPILAEARSIAEQLPERGSAELASIMHIVARQQVDADRFEEGEQLARRAVAMHRQLRPKHHPELGWAVRTLGYALTEQERYAEAESALREALAIFTRSYPAGHRSVEWTYRDLANVLSRQNKSTAELDQERLARETSRAQQSPQDPHAWVVRARIQATFGYWNEVIFSFENAQRLSKAPVPESNYIVAAGWSQIAGTLRDRERWEEAERMYGFAILLRKPLDVAASPEIYLAQANDIISRARTQAKLSRWEDLVHSVEAAAELGQAPLPQINYDLADEWSRLGTDLRVRHQRPAEAEMALRHAIALREPLDGDAPPLARLMQSNEYIGLGWTLQSLQRMHEADTSLREALRIRNALRTQFPDDPEYLRNLAYAVFFLERFLTDTSRFDEAQEALQQAAAHWHQLAGNSNLPDDLHQAVGGDLKNLGDQCMRRGNNALAESSYREALRIFERSTRTDSSAESRMDDLQHALAMVIREQGRFVEAEDIFRKVLASRTERDGKEYLPTAQTALELALTLMYQERFAEAEPFAREALRVREKHIGDHWMTANARSMLGGSLLGQKRYAEAEALLLPSYELMKRDEAQIPASAMIRLREALERVIALYEATGRTDEARRRQEELAALMATDDAP